MPESFFDVYPMRFSFVADHFQYLASIGVIVLIVAGIVIRDGLALNVLMLLWPLESVMEWQSGG